jgi:hypothetical protein
MLTPRAVTSRCKVAMLGDVFARSTRLMVFADRPHNSASARSDSPLRLRNFLNLGPISGGEISSIVPPGGCGKPPYYLMVSDRVVHNILTQLTEKLKKNHKIFDKKSRSMLYSVNNRDAGCWVWTNPWSHSETRFLRFGLPVEYQRTFHSSTL